MSDDDLSKDTLIALSRARIQAGPRIRTARTPKRTPQLPAEMRKACTLLGLKHEGLTRNKLFDAWIQYFSTRATTETHELHSLRMELFSKLFSWFEPDPEPPNRPAGARRMPTRKQI